MLKEQLIHLASSRTLSHRLLRIERRRVNSLHHKAAVRIRQIGTEERALWQSGALHLRQPEHHVGSTIASSTVSSCLRRLAVWLYLLCGWR